MKSKNKGGHFRVKFQGPKVSCHNLHVTLIVAKILRGGIP